MLGTYHATSLFEILKEIHFIYEPELLWKFVLKKACEAVASEGSTLYQIQPGSKELRVIDAYGVDPERLKNFPFLLGKGICGWVAEHRQAAIVTDTRKDPRFDRGVDIVTGFATKSVLCVPIMTKDGFSGVFELFNRKNGVVFSPQDQELMEHLAQQTAVAYANMQLVRQISKANDLMESIFQGLSGGLIVIDEHKNLLESNSSAARILGKDLKSFHGKPAQDALRDFPWFVELLAKTQETKATVARQETMLTLEGKPARVGYTTLLVNTRKGQIAGSGVIFQVLPS